MGAALWAGESALLTGLAGLTAHGLGRPFTQPAIRFLVFAPSWVRSAGVASLVRTTRPLPEATKVGLLSVAPPARCLLDAARYREASPQRLRGLTIKALQKRLLTRSEVLAEIRGGRRNHTKAVRDGVADFGQGAWSLPEAWCRELVVQCDLPPMLPNPRLTTLAGDFIGRPDGYFPDAGVAVQVHSREFHDGEDADGVDLWARTVAHDADYAAHGILVVGVAPSDLREMPGRFIRQLRGAIESRRGLPAPRVLVYPLETAA